MKKPQEPCNESRDRNMEWLRPIEARRIQDRWKVKESNGEKA